MKKLYLLRPKHGDKEVGAWSPWYDKCFGFVICAENEGQARKLADANAGSENYHGSAPWLDSRQSTCIELQPTTKAKIIIKDFNAA